MDISKHFSMHEALYLHQWDREATAEDGLTEEVLNNLKDLFAKLDQVRDHFGAPIIVHCAFRPTEYNKLVKGAKNSPHLYGMAVDFHIQDLDCDDVRKRILDDKLLETLNMRMEDMPGGDWVHLDTRAPSSPSHRFFKP